MILLLASLNTSRTSTVPEWKVDEISQDQERSAYLQGCYVPTRYYAGMRSCPGGNTISVYRQESLVGVLIL